MKQTCDTQCHLQEKLYICTSCITNMILFGIQWNVKFALQRANYKIIHVSLQNKLYLFGTLTECISNLEPTDG